MRPPFVVLASALALVIFAGVNLAAYRWLAPVRADFTEGRLYTLSDSARKVVSRLAEPVDLQLVFSREAAADYPALRAHAARVRELMAEIAARSSGQVRLSSLDPEPFSEEEDAVMLAGVSPLDGGEGDPIYLGLIGHNSVDDRIVIPFLSPDRDALLEYDLVRLIAQLDNPDPPRIALLSGLPAFDRDGRGESDPVLLQEVARAFRMTPLDRDFVSLPPDTDILMMLHPSTLSEWQGYVIDQFLVGGGRALIAVDPESAGAAEAGRPTASGLGPLRDTLRVSLSKEVVADAALALPVEVDAGQGRRRIERDPELLGLEGERLSRTDPVTADLTRAVLVSHVGAFAPEGAAEASFEPLMTATPADGADVGPVIAVRRSGRLTSAFDAPPPAPPAAPEAAFPDFRAESERPAEVILIADADLFDARLFANPADGEIFADNAAFILNALDNLGGDPALLALRSRTPAARPMTRVDQVEEAGQQRLAAEEPVLRQQLGALTDRMEAMMSAPAGARPLLEAEGGELAPLREEAARIQARLRELQREQRAGVDRLEGWMVAINVWIPPSLVALAGMGVFLWRSRRRRPA